MSPPRNLTIYNHTAVSVWLSWEPPLEPNGVVIQYGFRIRDLITHTVTHQVLLISHTKSHFTITATHTLSRTLHRYTQLRVHSIQMATALISYLRCQSGVTLHLHTRAHVCANNKHIIHFSNQDGLI